MNSSSSSTRSALPLAPGERLPVSKVLTLSPEALKEIDQLADKFPDRLAATLPALHIAQREFGFVSLEAMKAVAKALDIPEGHVYGVASFYSMYQKHPVGSFHIQVCTNISCALNGAVALLDLVKKKTGISQRGEVSSDGLWSVEEVECLASCGSGPCLQVNHDIYDEFVNEAELDRVLEACRSGQYREWAK
ncbi:MAG TPA: NAD(P)H-dependent oxidoreductase subunit E [Acidobacteria bacterium]|jgi:NADH-quinone oxidoreductase E subunit|nr:NAD(P)H-dependent oxidoreductase subunit E [Acidobacteriota bacterium]